MPNVRNSLAADTRADIGAMDLAELEARARGARASALSRASDLSLDLRQGRHRLRKDDRSVAAAARRSRRALPDRDAAVIAKDTSSDGTVKFLLGLEDGRRIESVFIPDTPSQTFCISTQVGCAMKCGFCLTGKMGLVRNLTAGEIAGQVRVLAGRAGPSRQRFNIVLMGMGEPLHNYDNTMKALRMLNDEHGLAVSPRRVTLSTVGVLPALERLADRTADAEPGDLAARHHRRSARRARAGQPQVRARSIFSRPPGTFPRRRRNRITFEYVLLDGVNDTPEDARRLVRLLGNIRCKVNLIPLNEAAGIAFERPSDARVDAFARILAERWMMVSVRKSRGRDIRAACGQLIVEGTSKSPGQQAAALLVRQAVDGHDQQARAHPSSQAQR